MKSMTEYARVFARQHAGYVLKSNSYSFTFVHYLDTKMEKTENKVYMLSYFL